MEAYWVLIGDMEQYIAALSWGSYGLGGLRGVIGSKWVDGAISTDTRVLRGCRKCVWYPDTLRLLWARAAKRALGHGTTYSEAQAFVDAGADVAALPFLERKRRGKRRVD